MITPDALDCFQTETPVSALLFKGEGVSRSEL